MMRRLTLLLVMLILGAIAFVTGCSGAADAAREYLEAYAAGNLARVNDLTCSEELKSGQSYLANATMLASDTTSDVGSLQFDEISSDGSTARVRSHGDWKVTYRGINGYAQEMKLPWDVVMFLVKQNGRWLVCRP